MSGGRSACEARHDDLAAYALGALDEREAALLEHHLETCEHCRERLSWLAPAVDVLPGAVEQRTPPAALRENLMAVVRDEAAPRVEPARKGRSWWAGLRGLVLRPAVGMAVLIVLVAGIGVGYVLRGGGTEEVAPQLTKAQSLNDSVPGLGDARAHRRQRHPARARASGDLGATRSTRSGCSARA